MTQLVNRAQRRAAVKHIAAESTKYPAHLVPIPPDEWPSRPSNAPILVGGKVDLTVHGICLHHRLSRTIAAPAQGCAFLVRASSTSRI